MHLTTAKLRRLHDSGMCSPSNVRELDLSRPVLITNETIAKTRKMKTVAKMIKEVVSLYARQDSRLRLVHMPEGGLTFRTND